MVKGWPILEVMVTQPSTDRVSLSLRPPTTPIIHPVLYRRLLAHRPHPRLPGTRPTYGRIGLDYQDLGLGGIEIGRRGRPVGRSDPGRQDAPGCQAGYA
jgi:hypothetical protein